MEIIPAIDLRGGRCVRLYQGDYDKETVYYEDPVEAALYWEGLGAKRIHIVDLDGAASGVPGNLHVVKAIASEAKVSLQMGGGIRSLKVAEAVVNLGVERVVLGTSAVLNSDLVAQVCRKLGSKSVVVGVDALDGMVAIKGWKEKTDFSALELVRRMANLGVERFIYTDISRDGTLTEPNFQAIEDLVSQAGLFILASGGISSLEHLKRLSNIGVEGAILGRAIYMGAIDLKDALGLAA